MWKNEKKKDRPGARGSEACEYLNNLSPWGIITTKEV